MTSSQASRRRSILLLSLAAFSSMAVQRMCDAMLPEFSRVFSASLAQVAQVVSVFAVVYGVAQFFYGPLGDRFGKFRIVAYAALACSCGNSLAVVSTDLDGLVITRVMVALGAAAIIPLSLAWIGDNIAYELRQATLARFGLGLTLGITGGQLVGGLLTDTLGWRWVFVFMSLLFGVVGFLLLYDWRHQPAVTRVAGPVRPAGLVGIVRQVWLTLTGPWSRTVLFVAFIEGAVGFGVPAIWASHLHLTLGLSLMVASFVAAMFGIGGMLYMLTASGLIRRFGERGLTLLGAGLFGLSALMLGYAPRWEFALAASGVAGFGFFMFHNTMQVNATQMTPEARGTALSLFASALFLGQSAGVMVAAMLVPHIGSGAVIALGGATLVVLGAWFGRALRRHHARVLGV